MKQSQALTILKTGVNVFLTGEPGSGKTHTINQYVAYLRERGVEPAITASTGIAATHIGGTTIHSWSGIGIKRQLDKYQLDEISSNKYIAERVHRAKIIIIDEVSMLPPETIAMVDAVCSEIKRSPEPFGGLQVILVGDFFQLPPVVRAEATEGAQTRLEIKPPRFAFDSSAWARVNPMTCYLTEQHRQDDVDLLSVLSAIRRDVFGDDHLSHLKTRKIEPQAAPKRAPKLFSHNVDVDRVNDETLAELAGQARVFMMSSHGRDKMAEVLKKGCLSPEELCLKVGAAVMFTKNNSKEGFVNGTLGTVLEFDQKSGYPIVKTRSGQRIEVEPMDWTVEENGMIRARITQLPLRLAWAITVHKSQGVSLDEAVMDLSDVFEFGQGYVALSRVRRLSGLYLLGWNERAFRVHPEVLGEDEVFRLSSSEAETAFAKILPVELEKMQKNFLTACGGRPKPSGVEKSSARVNKRKGINTRDETLALWNKGNNISQIAKERGLKEQTVLNHIEELLFKGKINREELARLLTPALTRHLPDIQAAFRELKTDRLSLVFEKFGGAYSYDDLRIARMTLN